MRNLWRVGVLAVVIALGAIGAVYLLDRPVIPAIGAAVEVDRTALRAEDMEPLPANAAGGLLVSWECSQRLQKASLYADLCWGVVRQADLDPEKDHYALHVGGTFGGQNVRWIALEARPLGTTMLAGTDGLPLGSSAGCHPLPLSLSNIPQSGVVYADQLCGRVSGGPGDVEGSWRVSWACEPCLMLESADREIDLEFSVIVPDGTIPNWSILADLGT